jgi:hypothetical protein
MAFVCTAAMDKSPFDVILNTIVLPIGYDDERRELSYSAVVGCTPLPGGADMEYFFYIVEGDREERLANHHWTGLQTKGLISDKVDRRAVLYTVLFGTDRLLKTFNHSRYFCCTYDSDLPEKALSKYYRVVETFRMCGYEAKEQPVLLGKNSWWLERP